MNDKLANNHSRPVIHPNVTLGKNVVIEDFCVVGYPPGSSESGELETVIGDNTIIRTHAVIYAGCRIGNNCHIGHGAYIREHTSVGDKSSIGINVIIEHHCTVGKNVRIQGQAGLCEHTIIEDDAWIGPRVVTANVLHPTCDKAKECLAGPIVRKGAIIGANAVLSPDIEVGERAFIGAGSVVTKSVIDAAIMFGNPAKKIGDIGKVSCKYEIMDGKNPFDEAEPPKNKFEVPLIDLSAQYQNHKQNLRLAIDKVILNSRFINGEEVAQFENSFAKFCGVKHAIGVSNGTDALILALATAGIGQGDEVITTTHTFFATAEAILAVRATPVFVDIDEATYTIDPKQIEEKITDRTRAIIAVHLYGMPAAMEDITAIAKKHDLIVIEDAAQAHGAEIHGKRVGQWGDFACFSFYPGKNLGAFGDAGAVVTNNDKWADSLRKLKDHGRSSKYLHEIPGFNNRMDTIQAAVLCVKLKELDKWNQARRDIAGRYRQGLKGLPIECFNDQDGISHVYHLFVVRTKKRDELRAYLKSKGIASGLHYPVPLHMQPAMKSFQYSEGDFPVTEKVVNEILSLPIYPELSTDKQDYIVETIRDFFDLNGNK